MDSFSHPCRFSESIHSLITTVNRGDVVKLKLTLLSIIRRKIAAWIDVILISFPRKIIKRKNAFFCFGEWLVSLSLAGCTPYCIIEMNDGQRQTTPVLCDTLNLQWNILFRFSIADLDRDTLTCSIYDRSKYTTDRRLISTHSKTFRLVSIVSRPSRFDHHTDVITGGSPIPSRWFFIDVFASN